MVHPSLSELWPNFELWPQPKRLVHSRREDLLKQGQAFSSSQHFDVSATLHRTSERAGRIALRQWRVNEQWCYNTRLEEWQTVSYDKQSKAQLSFSDKLKRQLVEWEGGPRAPDEWELPTRGDSTRAAERPRVQPPFNMAVDEGASASVHFLDTVEGEISFFRSLMRARPVGLHRHFHVLSMRNAIHQDTGQYVAIDDIWAKLRSCYDMDTLENLVRPLTRLFLLKAAKSMLQETEGYESPGSSSSTPHLVGSPAPSDNLAAHPFFRKEFSLPPDPAYETLLAARRLRGASEPPSPSEPSPARPTKTTSGRGRKRGRSNANLAGLVGGESDSSALTQESGDESVAPTPRESVVTGTDAGTDYADGDEEEAAASPGTWIYQCCSSYSDYTQRRQNQRVEGVGRRRGEAARGEGAPPGADQGGARDENGSDFTFRQLTLCKPFCADP
ncbi:hypothetical protein EVG20_g2348 [Dentipellis fragilis]|uniref:Uncharacterized protein n=1 Tax=Dentipellis fragilis TaxID=205917 RepID=A0A4Y9Z897_9AGAM|nr:hypothetical protein EVG20_g2348 [Dentipellis fragilis]